MSDLFIGTAGWSLASSQVPEFPLGGTHLERYARRFEAVEINSCFYRPHQKKTYERWAASTPEHFRFALKVPKTITHENRLASAGDLLARFLDESSGLGDKRGVLLVQMPPSLALDEPVAREFFAELRRRYAGHVAVEPRHATWFTTAGDRLLLDFAAARVAADPAPIPAAAEAGGETSFAYYRLHGSPRIYYSDYPEEKLREHAAALARSLASGAETWCIYDNTAAGAATPNALTTRKLLEGNSLSDHAGRPLAS